VSKPPTPPTAVGCAQRAADLLDRATELAMSGTDVSALLDTAAAWRELGIVIARNPQMTPRPDDDEPESRFR